MSEHEYYGQLIDLKRSLEKFAFRLTQKEEDAKDLVQETCLRVLLNRGKYVNYQNFKAWAFTIMRNTFINDYRSNFRHQTFRYHTKDSFLNDHEGFIVSEGPDSTYSVKEINSSIEQLGNKLRIPFKMHVQGFKYKEIAEELKLNIGTVKSRIFLSRQQLMIQLTK